MSTFLNTDIHVTATTATTVVDLEFFPKATVEVDIEADTVIDATNIEYHARVLVFLFQDSVGGHTVSFASKFKFPDGNQGTFTTTANGKDVLQFEYVGGEFLLISCTKNLM